MPRAEILHCQDCPKPCAKQPDIIGCITYNKTPHKTPKLKRPAPTKLLVIRCLPRPDGSGMMFQCPFCKTWHLHGIGNGPRVDHCTNPESPFKQHGYFIKMLPKAELREIMLAIRDYLERPSK